MALEGLAQALPSYARDIAANLAALEAETILSPQQLWGAFIASAQAVAQPRVVGAMAAAATEAGLSSTTIDAAKAAAAVMAQNNVYFRAISLLKNQAYRSMRTRLRMSRVSNPGVEAVDFHLWCVAVSAIHGCPDCLDAHEGALRALNAPPEKIQAALRIAAVTHAASRVLIAEAAARAPIG